MQADTFNSFAAFGIHAKIAQMQLVSDFMNSDFVNNSYVFE